MSRKISRRQFVEGALAADAQAMKATNAPEADRFIRREYRKEWQEILET